MRTPCKAVAPLIAIVCAIQACGAPSAPAPRGPVVAGSAADASRSLVASDSAFSYGSFTAVLRDSLGNQLVNRPLTWFSSDTSIVEIVTSYDALVWVRGKRAGSAVVRATSEGKTGQGSVTVTP